MTPEQSTEIAKQIIDGVVWAQWPIYALALTVAFLFHYMNKRLEGYAKKVGELKAITGHFEQLLIQSKATAEAVKGGELAAISGQFEKLTAELKTNTETVERVKTEISHGDWSAREWKTLQRQKLEKLLEFAMEVNEWNSRYSDQLVFEKNAEPGINPMHQVRLIGLLYFPELQSKIDIFCSIQNEYIDTVTRFGRELLENSANIKIAEVQRNPPGHQAAIAVSNTLRKQYVAEIQAIQQRLTNAKTDIEQAAAAILQQVVGLAQ